jgi:hypothetical protein
MLIKKVLKEWSRKDINLCKVYEIFIFCVELSIVDVELFFKGFVDSVMWNCIESYDRIKYPWIR